MGLNLRCVGIEVQSELFDKDLRTGLPVDIGIGRNMGIVVTHRTIHLAQQGYDF